MADPTPGTTPTPGATTSEYAVTKVAMILSIAATVVGIAVDTLQSVQAAAPNFKWIAPVLTALGIIGSVLTALGYQYTRAQIKVAAHNAAAASSAADAAKNVGS